MEIHAHRHKSRYWPCIMMSCVGADVNVVVEIRSPITFCVRGETLFCALLAEIAADSAISRDNDVCGLMTFGHMYAVVLYRIIAGSTE